LPALFSPSVNKTSTWLFERLSFSRLAAAAWPTQLQSRLRLGRSLLDQILQKPIVIQRIGSRHTDDRQRNDAMRSFGRASMNFCVTSRIASTRVASWPPIVKSFVSIEPETSSTSMISIRSPQLREAFCRVRTRRATTKKASVEAVAPAGFYRSRRALSPIARRLRGRRIRERRSGPAFSAQPRKQRYRQQQEQQPGRANVNRCCSKPIISFHAERSPGISGSTGASCPPFNKPDWLLPATIRCPRFVPSYFANL